MKRAPILLAVIAIGVAAIIYGQRHHAEAPVSPAPLLHVIGDTERDLTRVPMKLTQLSDEEEVKIGNENLLRPGAARPEISARINYT